VVEPKMTALGLAVNRLAAAEDSAAAVLLAGNAEVQPVRNKLRKIAETLKHCMKRLPLLGLPWNLLLGELVTVMDSLR
jgi:hypothetical protein